MCFGSSGAESLRCHEKHMVLKKRRVGLTEFIREMEPEMSWLFCTEWLEVYLGDRLLDLFSDSN